MTHAAAPAAARAAFGVRPGPVAPPERRRAARAPVGVRPTGPAVTPNSRRASRAALDLRRTGPGVPAGSRRVAGAASGMRPRPVAPPDDPPTARPAPSYLGGAR